MKVRQAGRVVKVAVMVANGVNADGYREVLGSTLSQENPPGGSMAAYQRITGAEGGVDGFSQRRVRNARLTLKVWRVFMPLFFGVCSCAAIAGKLSGGFGALTVAYLVMVVIFQAARSDGGLPVRVRNLIFQP
jgi:hypothetical protein